MGEVLHGSLLQLLLEHCDFLNINISQGSVATRLKCGGIFKYELVANLPVSLQVKEFWKSVNIWGSYGQEFGVLFFLRHSVDWARYGFSAVAGDNGGHICYRGTRDRFDSMCIVCTGTTRVSHSQDLLLSPLLALPVARTLQKYDLRLSKQIVVRT